MKRLTLCGLCVDTTILLEDDTNRDMRAVGHALSHKHTPIHPPIYTRVCVCVCARVCVCVCVCIICKHARTRTTS
jgi:hypothetical protein